MKKIIQKLFGYCHCCRRWLVYPKKRQQNTAYVEDEFNYVVCCKDCIKEINSHWDEMWAEYFSSRL